MSRPKYAKRRDANEGPIVKALRALGVSVIQLDDTDLLCGWRGQNYLLEVKNPESARGRADLRRPWKGSTGEKQKKWRESWRGQQAVVTSLDEALEALGLRRVA